MKIVTVGARLSLGGAMQWGFEAGVRIVGQGDRRFLESIEIPVSPRLGFGSNLLSRCFVYQYDTFPYDFEIVPDLREENHVGGVYVFLDANLVTFRVSSDAHFRNPVYGKNKRSGVCQIWLLWPGESLWLEYHGMTWEIINNGGLIRLERFQSRNVRTVIFEQQKIDPVVARRNKIESLRRRQVELQRSYDEVTAELERLDCSTSRYCRPGCGYLGDPLPP